MMNATARRAQHRRRERTMLEDRLSRTWLVMEGDWGGQIYLTCPLNLLRPRPEVVALDTSEERDPSREMIERAALLAAGVPPDEVGAMCWRPDSVLMMFSDKGYRALLHELDQAGWACNEGEGGGMYLHEVSAIAPLFGVSGGMGGGALTEGLWLHDKFTTGLDIGPKPEDPTYWPRRAAELLGIAAPT